MFIIGFNRAAAPAIGGSAPQLVNTLGTQIPTSAPIDPVLLDLPPGGQAGDMVLVAVFCDQSLTLAGGVTAGQGYTDIEPRSAGNSPGYQIAYKFMGATPDGTISINRNGNRAQAVAIAVIRGVRQSAVPGEILDGTVQRSTGGSAMPNPPSLTTSQANSLRVIIGGCDDGSMASVTAPGGFGNLVVANTTAPGGTAATGCVAFAAAPSPGALDPDAFGGTPSAVSANVAFHFALRKA